MWFNKLDFKTQRTIEFITLRPLSSFLVLLGHHNSGSSVHRFRRPLCFEVPNYYVDLKKQKTQLKQFILFTHHFVIFLSLRWIIFVEVVKQLWWRRRIFWKLPHKSHTAQFPFASSIHKDGGLTQVSVNQSTIIVEKWNGFLTYNKLLLINDSTEIKHKLTV